MTHTSTEQPELPEALRLANWLDTGGWPSYVPQESAAELRRLHARVQELEAQTAHMADLVELADYATKKLEAFQEQRVPLSDAEIGDFWEGATGGHSFNDETRRDFVRSIERAHGITQEKQG